MPRATGDSEAEADRLVTVVQANVRELAEARLGPRVTIEGFTFRLHRQDRNTIYRVSAGSSWFLKLPRADHDGAITREQLGARIVHEAVGSKPEYGGAPVLRILLAPPLVVAATIQGTSMDRALMANSLLPWPGSLAAMEHSFATLGMLLATLHVAARPPHDIPKAVKRPFAALEKRLRRVTSHDPVTKAIAEWFGAHGRPDRADEFVHGNMRLDNVMRVGKRIGFLDFEHCGAGVFYQDLARPVVHLLQVSSAWPLAHARVARCLAAYLSAYRQVHPYDPRELDTYVAVRQSRYYLDTRNSGMFSEQISGVPVRRSSSARLTLALLREGVAGVMPAGR